VLRAGRLPVLPDIEGLRFQAVHAADVAEAYRRAVTDPRACGATAWPQNRLPAKRLGIAAAWT
jgi:uncharacterized protein YbjT (DUF2867 family)